MFAIALKTLFADRGKLLTALVGVVFSVVLVNVQGGLYWGFILRAGLLVDHSQADIWVGHKQSHNVDFPRDVPRRWLARVRTVPGVARAEPYLIGWSDMTLPSGGFESVVVVGLERGSQLGTPWNLNDGDLDLLLLSDAVLYDECEAEKLEFPCLGDVRELGGRRARLVGTTRGIVGFLVAPYIFTSYDRACAFLNKDPDACSYYLVRIDPGVNAEEVCDRIRRRVPDLDAFPTGVYSRISLAFWTTRTGLGISFGAATALGLLVGVLMVAQTLYALVLDRLGEFGTLKAIGATERQVYSILLAQASFMAVAGAVIGLGIVLVVQRVFSTPRAPMAIPWWLSLGSCALVLAICVLSAGLPYRRIRKLDPMMVLQS
jgi:putative ABC transport system permease protein